VAYKPSEFLLHRDWPREKIDRRDGKPRGTDNPSFEGIFCWHGVLLNRSSKFDRKHRMKKRHHREIEFLDKGLKFIPLEQNNADFFWEDFREELYEPAKFIWY
jgi:hypothetical protein